MASSESQGNFCCDPYKRHRGPISGNLRKITAQNVATNSNLVVGSYWCDNCRKYVVSVDAGVEVRGDGHRGERNIRDNLQGLDCSSIQIPPSQSAAAGLEEGNQAKSNVCCDPHKRHKKAITKNLRKITAQDAETNSDLIVGLHWCDSCRKYVVSDNETTRLIGKKDLDGKCEVVRKDGECCNPFDIHSIAIHKGLRKIKEIDKERHPAVTVGLFWCDTCRKVSPAHFEDDTDSQEMGVKISLSQSSGTTDSPSLSPTVLTEVASQKLKSIGLSPLVTNTRTTRTQAAKVSAAKRKIEEATTVVQTKVCRALGLIEEDVENAQARKARDHDLLMNKIKEKLPSASKILRFQLLSLVPASMSVREAARFFNVGRSLFETARKYTEEKGILPIPDFSRASSVLESTRLLVINYYCNDGNSKIMPGIRDCVSIRKGVYEQKRLLLSNLPELYQSFKQDHEGIKVGVSTFCSLKPKWCVSAGEAGTHEQCICQTHQNFKLVMYALNIKTHYRDLISLCVCDSKDRHCMLRICEQCPTLEEVRDILKSQIEMPALSESELLSSDDEYDFFDENVKYRQWKSTDRTEMIAQVCSRADLLEIAAKQMSDLIPHDFISCSQRDYLKKLKEELPLDKVIVAMDFSMNYNCLIQGAVQSYHWSPKQATVHPTVIYFKDSNNELQHKSIIFISDDLDHDVPLVKKFQEKTASWIKENLSHIKEIEYASDGCASQYKSKGYFKNLCGQESEFGFKVSHTYFATSHGKSQCDADGGSVKRKARQASLQRPLDNQIINAHDLFEFCTSEMGDKFLFQFVSRTEVEDLRKMYIRIMPKLQTVPGTRTFHFVKPSTDNSVACWKISNDQYEEPFLIHALTKVPRPSETLSVFNGMYVVIRLGNNRYVAMVTDVYSDESEVDVSLLMPKLPAKELHWPKDIKTATIPLPHVLCEVALEEKLNKMYLTSSDVEKMYTSRILRRPR